MVDRAVAVEQGLHSTGSRTNLALGPKVRLAGIGRPKTASVGIPRAAARCIGPESFERKSESSERTPMSWPSEVFPWSMRGGPPSSAARTPLARALSDAPPRITTRAPIEAASFSITSPKRVALQIFARLPLAPG
jgi:hypothetical protein